MHKFHIRLYDNDVYLASLTTYTDVIDLDELNHHIVTYLKLHVTKIIIYPK